MGIAKEHLTQADRTDIARRYLAEPKMRGSEIWANCPWHVESTPGGAFSYNPETDLAYCNSCGARGDLVDVYGGVRGMGKEEAFREFVAELCPQAKQTARRQKTPRPPGARQSQPIFTPREAQDASSLWRSKAERLIVWAREKLEEKPEMLEWLGRRGISSHAAARHCLGFNPGEHGRDIWRERSSWGLPREWSSKTGKEKKLWLPVGLTIPVYRGEILHRIRIRRFQVDQLPKYCWVPGSGEAPLLISRKGQAKLPDAVVVVEAELDAILIHECAGDLVHAVSLGTLQGKPSSREVAELCRSASAILLALDFESQPEKVRKALAFWRHHFPRAEYWPVPAGKDPGEAYQAGCDIREWIRQGLPPVFSVKTQGAKRNAHGEEAKKKEAAVHPAPAPDVSAGTDGPLSSGQVDEGKGSFSDAGPQGPGHCEERMEESQELKDSSIPATVRELTELMLRLNVQVKQDDLGNLGLVEDAGVARDNWQDSKRISELVFEDVYVAWTLGCLGSGTWSGSDLLRVQIKGAIT